MAATESSNGKGTSEAFSEQVSFTVEPGAKLKIILDVGEEIFDGKVPCILNGFSSIIGSAQVPITLQSYSAPTVAPLTYTFDGQGTKEQPELSFELPQSAEAQPLQFEVLLPDLNDAKVHIWELKLHSEV